MKLVVENGIYQYKLQQHDHLQQGGLVVIAISFLFISVYVCIRMKAFIQCVYANCHSFHFSTPIPVSLRRSCIDVLIVVNCIFQYLTSRISKGKCDSEE